MSQGPLYPNLSQKVQKEESQMSNRKLSCAMLYRWFKCKLKPPKKHFVEGPLSPVNEIFQKDLNHNSDFVFFIGGSLESP